MKRLLTAIALIVIVVALVSYRRKRAARYALKYEGVKEVGSNSGFDDATLQSKLADVGWKKGEAWCAYYVRMVYLAKYPAHEAELKQLVSPSVPVLYNNFVNDKSGNWIVSQTPREGALVVWLGYTNGKADGRGHVGIVTRFNREYLFTIEGNTSTEGGGEGVNRKQRGYDWNLQNGLRLMGFIYKK